MAEFMDKETKKVMDEIEAKSFFKPSTKEEVGKFVRDGGMEKYVKVDGAYREKDDIDGTKLRKERNKSKWLLAGLVVAILIFAALVLKGIIPE